MQNSKNTFFAKAIENWLTNTNELGYQLPFCQLLLNEGKRLIHISKHNAFEQGKDIIAKDREGVTHVYQLKGGNISLSIWRNIVKAEIEELIELSVIHPSVNKSDPFIPYLVTNGYLEDTVRTQIDNLNNGKWKSTPLKVIVLGELLANFIEWSYEFTPKEIANYKIFLDLYFADGTELVDEIQIARLLESILLLQDSNSLTKIQRKRNIGASVLLAGYAMSPLKVTGNYIALIQLLTLLGSYILATAEKFELAENAWRPSFELVWSELYENIKRLEEEMSTNGLKDLYQSMWDGEIAPYRRHTAMGYLIAGKLAQLLKKDDEWSSLNNTELLIELVKTPVIAGETSLLSFVFLDQYLNKLKSDGNEVYLVLALEAILLFNGRKSPIGLPCPYYGIESAIKMNLGLLEEDEIQEQFVCRSFLLDSIIQLLARRNRRDVLQTFWREISYIQMERFEPDELWKNYLWRNKDGLNVSEFPHATASWASLCSQAEEEDENSVPKLLRKLPFFIPLFLLVYPHRARPNTLKYLSTAIAKI